MNRPAVSIIIVSYNTRDITAQCLASVYAQTHGIEFEVLVVDNASSDGSAQHIAAAFPQVRLWDLDHNLGFGGACNFAAGEARGEYLLMLNPDTIVLDGAVQKLVRHARAHPGAGLVGGRTLWEDRTLNPTSCWRRPTPWSVFCRATGLDAIFRGNALFDSESYGRWQRDTDREVDIVTGCLMLVHRDDWARLGGFDPQFFQRGEDADLSLKAWSIGFRPRICAEATIVHLGGRSETNAVDKIVRNLKARQMLFDRYWRPTAARFGAAMLRLWVLTRLCAWRLKRTAAKADMYRAVWRRRADYGRFAGREVTPAGKP